MHIIPCNSGRHFPIILVIRDATRKFQTIRQTLARASGSSWTTHGSLDKTSVIQISANMADDGSSSSFDSGYLLETWMLQ